MAKVIGIDPGISGAMAMLERGRLLWACDLPILTETVNGKRKRRVNCVRLAAMLANAEPELVMLERVHASPGMGVSSAFSFGETFGLISAAILLAGCQLELVTPQAWKAALACPADKSLTMAKATLLFGGEHWPKAGDHGKAEAALLAEYGRRKHGLDGAA